MKKQIIAITILLALLLCSVACTSEENESTISQTASSDTSKEASSEKSGVEEYIYTGTEAFTNRTLKNTLKMGDVDGPAYCVYAKSGYNKASFDVELSKIDLNIFRSDNDRQHVNAYIFMGIDVYDTTGQWWQNCIDTGIVYSSSAGWHVFYNMYLSLTGDYGWYESTRRLNASHDYTIELDSSKEDGKCTLTVYDFTTGKKADTVTFELAYALKDGSNTAYLMNFALDYPEDIKLDTRGNPSEDWIEITYYNSDVGIKMNNIRVRNAMLFKGDDEFIWTSERTYCRGIWPDSTMGFEYDCTSVHHINADSEFIVDLDMNRKED